MAAPCSGVELAPAVRLGVDDFLGMAGASVDIDFALFHHQLDALALLQDADISERVAVDRDDIGDLAGLECAEVLVALALNPASAARRRAARGGVARATPGISDRA